MARMGGFSAAGMRGLQKQLDGLRRGDADAFVGECARELAARLLAKAIKRTPVGDYPAGSGKRGGTLRRGWTSRTREEAGGGGAANAKAYADSLEIRRDGDVLVVEIVNPVEYASYVEYGHRTADHKGWVPGRFMLTISEQEVREIAPRVLEARVRRFLGGCMR